jgi:opacity protein-like surface antigen
MKFVLIGAAAVAAAAFVTPALAQDVVSPARYCAQYYPDGYCPIAGYTSGRDYRGDDWRNGMAMQALDNNAYRYHGGPKYND